MLHEARVALVVDDEEEARMFVRSILENERWQVIEADTGRRAIELAQDEQPELIVLDVMMPEADGFEVYRKLRGDAATENIPIVMLTAVNEFESGARHDEESMEAESGLRRPEGFVDKPVDPGFLLFTINGIMG
ncbi:MAG: response regulator [Candidatus Hydrogenedentes bacterium]|nr:response regulator [Candidatus Hydrogenedentota bacterium]